MQKANVIGVRYLSKLRLQNGELLIIPVDKSDHDNASQELMNTKVPADKRPMVWEGSAEVPEYDTPTGGINNGYYADAEVGFYWVKEASKVMGRVAVEFIVNDEITDLNQVDYSYG